MLVIAHRGASGEYPENSLLAITKAFEQNADGVEIDVQFHQESGEFIVFHDRTLERLTDKKGTINSYSLTQLLQTPIGENQYLITLSQAITVIPPEKTLNIELKISHCQQNIIEQLSNRLQSILKQAVQQQQITWKQVYISSFNHHLIHYCNTLMPTVKTAALISHSPLDHAAVSEQLNVVGVNQEINHLNQEFVIDAHQRGLSCWVFTVDSEKDIMQCLAWGVDGIFTNYPQQTRRIMARNTNPYKKVIA